MIGRDYSEVGSRASVIRQSDQASADVVTGHCVVHFPRDDLLICCDSNTGAVFLYRKHSTERLELAVDAIPNDAASAASAAAAGKFIPSCALLSPHHGLLLCDRFKRLILPFTPPAWAIGAPIEPKCSTLRHCSHLCATAFGHLLVVDSINHRFVVLTADGHEFIATGRLGDQRGEFREPCAVAWFVHNDRDPNYPATYRDPAWYTPHADRPTSVRNLAGARPGSVRLRNGAIPGEWEADILDIQGRIHTYKIREDRPGRYLSYSQEGDLLLEANVQASKSLFSAVRSLPGIRQLQDDRKRSIVAVADTGNDRVQLLWMYRVQSEVHRPEIVAQAVIGGKTGSTTHLSSPASVAFTPKGDFVICDTGHKRVVIVATDLVILCEFAFTLHWRNKVDSTPVSVHASPSGSIAIGFKRGGFAVFRGCTTNSAGDFEQLSLRCASLIMQSLTFADAKSLATTCTYFWKQLSARRRQWTISPMQPSRFTRAQYLYLKWAHNNVGARPWKLVDGEGRPVCKDFLAGRCTRLRCSETHQPPDIKQLIRKYDPVLRLENGLEHIVGQLYNLDFLHSMQNVMRSYFDSFASVQLVAERFERSRVAVRQVQETECKTLSYQYTIELLTMLEEHFTGCTPIRTQPVFARQVVIVPSSRSFGKFMADPLEQYDPEIGIPWTRSRNRQRIGNGRLSSALVPKKLLPQGALSDAQRETHLVLHMQAAERLSQSLTRMFK